MEHNTKEVFKAGLAPSNPLATPEFAIDNFFKLNKYRNQETLCYCYFLFLLSACGIDWSAASLCWQSLGHSFVAAGSTNKQTNMRESIFMKQVIS